MKLEVTKDLWDEFSLNEEFAYKDGKIYDIYKSSKSYFVGNCLGDIRVVVEDGKVLQWIYPLMGAGAYKILNKETIEQYRTTVLLYDMKRIPHVADRLPVTLQEMYDYNRSWSGGE